MKLVSFKFLGKGSVRNNTDMEKAHWHIANG